MTIEKDIEKFHEQYNAVQKEMGRVIVGNQEVVSSILSCLFTRGHVLLEGIPGLGKTKIVQTLASVLNLKFNRIQFTPDLLPGDVVGIPVYHQGTGEFRVNKGPIFANLLSKAFFNPGLPFPICGLP